MIETIIKKELKFLYKRVCNIKYNIDCQIINIAINLVLRIKKLLLFDVSNSMKIYYRP
jgi:hypothetical protein